MMATPGPTYSLRAFSNGGTPLDRGILPAWSTLKCTTIHNSRSVLSFQYALNGENADLIVNQREVALYDDKGEIPDCRFIIDNAKGNVVSMDGVLYKDWTAHSLWTVLDTTTTRPDAMVGINGSNYTPKKDGRAFASATPGQILVSLLTDAAARGTELQGLTWDFSSTLTSSGGAWASNDIDVVIPWGQSIAQTIEWLIAQNEIDARLNGRVIQVYNDGGLNTDRTSGATPVVLWAGDSTIEIPEERDTAGLYTTVLVKGKDNLLVEVDDAAARALWNRRVGFLSDDKVKTLARANKVGGRWIAARNGEMVQRSAKFTVSGQSPTPWRSFNGGDNIWLDTGGDLAIKRVLQIDLDVDATGEDQNGVCTLTLGTRFATKSQNVRDGIAAATGGSHTVGGSAVATPPRREMAEPVQASQPLFSAPSTYLIVSGGTPMAQITISWPSVVTDTEGLPLDGLAHYELYWKYNADSLYQPPVIIRDTTFILTGLKVGVGITAYVQAVTVYDVKGAASLTATTTTAADVTAPAPPSTPTMTTDLGTIRIQWDGLDNVGAAPPADFRQVEVHISTASGFTATAANRVGFLQGAGAVIATDLVIGTPYYAKLVARDTSNNFSTSAQGGPVTPTGVSGIDMATGSIGYDAIAFKDMDNLVADGSFESTAMDAQRSMAAAWSIITEPAATAFHGTRFARLNGPTNPGTQRVMYLTGFIDVRFGDQLWVRLAQRRSATANGNFYVTCQQTLADGTTTWFTVFSLTDVSGNWIERSGYYTPGSTVEKVRFYVEVDTGSTLGTNDVDAVEVRHVTGTALIMDAAISNAKIQNLAVDDAKIANLDGGKINAQSITSEEVKVGVLGRNLLPNGTFEDGMFGWWGWFLGVGGGSNTVAVDTTGVDQSSGKNCLKMGAEGPYVSGPDRGTWLQSDIMTVIPLKQYRLGGNIKATVATTIGFSMYAQWVDGFGTLVQQDNTDYLNSGLSIVYEDIAQTLTCPAGAVGLRIYIVHKNPDVTSYAVLDEMFVVEIGVGASQLTPSGLRVWGPDGSLVIDLTSKLTGNFFNILKAGVEVASINREGLVSATQLSSTNDPVLMGSPLLGKYATNFSSPSSDPEDAWFDRMPRGVVGWGLVDLSSIVYANGAYKGMAEIAFDVEPGRTYRLTVGDLLVVPQAANNRAGYAIYISNASAPGGEAPTPNLTNSIQLSWHQIPLVTSGSNCCIPSQSIIMRSSADGTLASGGEFVSPSTARILVAMQAPITGTVTVSSSATRGAGLLEITVEDIGPLVSDKVISNTSTTGTPATPASPVKTYTKTYLCSGGRAYNGSGVDIGTPPTQGYYSSTNGNQRAVICFPSVTGDIGTGTVTKVEVYLNFNHWYNNAGGTAVIGTHPFASYPASFGIGDTNVKQDLNRQSGWDTSGKWVRLPSSTYADFKSGAAKGILLGPGPSTSHEYYGYIAGNNDPGEPQLRVTYEK